MRYRAEIDGLRAVAVLPVMFFHAGFDAFSGGFVGVDVFFVISGYLITSIILSDQQAGRFSLRQFYERRARRILPALFLVMAACLPVAWLYLDAVEFKEFGQSVTATSLFSSNVYFFLRSGYFDTASELKPLLHTWSLAVEEQYYVMFPLLLGITYRLGRLWTLRVLMALGIGSLCYAQWASLHAPSAGFYLLPSRMWELALGAVVAYRLLTAGGAAGSQWLSLIGLGMILASVLVYDESTPFPGFYALLPTVGTVLIILFATPDTWANRILTTRPLVGLGLISYSAYLWHQPLLAFGRVYVLGELSVFQSSLAIVATLLLALATKKYVEDYFRYRFLKTRGPLLLATSAAVATTFAAFGLVSHLSLGFPGRNTLSLQLAQNFGLSDRCDGAPFTEKACRTAQDPQVILWGDSYAMHIARPMSMVSRNGLLQATLSDCPPILGYTEARFTGSVSCEAYNRRVLDELLAKADPQKVVVVLASNFGALLQDGWAQRFAETLQLVSDRGFKVAIVSPPPSNGAIIKCIKLADRANSSFAACRYPRRDIQNRQKQVFDILSAISTEAGVPLVDLREALCDESNCHVTAGGTLLYRDNGHLSNASAPFIAQHLSRSLSHFLVHATP